jgi:glutamine---fructose-6-phosphate transaminase (isomerizing)
MLKSNLRDSAASLMQTEAKEAPIKIAQQLKLNSELVNLVAGKIREFNPYSVMFVGRGSSDHAGTFAKYLIEIELGIATFSAAPSVATIYNRNINLSQTLVLIISQSGRSPDIVAQAKRAKASGAMCVAILNEQDSPLSETVDFVIPLQVGPESSVAATKSYLATLSALLQLVASWKKDSQLLESLGSIPSLLDVAIKSEPQLILDDLNKEKNLVVLGRGLGYAIGKEVALKLKEVLGIHAECFSSAEFLHGPVTLVNRRFKVLNIIVKDESYLTHCKQIKDINSRGAVTVDLFQQISDVHPRMAPLMILQRFYLDIERIAIAKGINPDTPKGLKKVTETI